MENIASPKQYIGRRILDPHIRFLDQYLKSSPPNFRTMKRVGKRKEKRNVTSVKKIREAEDFLKRKLKT